MGATATIGSDVRQGMGAPVVDTMSGSDALLWTISSDPVMRPTIVAVMMLESTPDWSEVRDRVRDLAERVPRLRSVALPRAPGRPRFVETADFDLSLHLRRMRLSGRGTVRDVLDLAQSMASSGFDAAQPLWEAVLVEGVDGEHAAMIMKVHHALIDGVGGLSILAHLFDPLGQGTPRTAHGAQPAAAASPSSGLRQLRDLGKAVGVVDTALDAVFHPVRSLGHLAAVGVSVGKLMAPARRPLSPIMLGRGFRRQVEVVDLDMQELRDAAEAWGGTVNDVFVSSVVRGLTLYHAQHGVLSRSLRALMPVNVQSERGDEGGNHFVPARFVVPIHADVADCVAEVRRIADSWKHAPGLGMSDVLADALSALPGGVARSLWSSMLRGDDFVVTNIPGPPVQVHLAGVAVESIYAFSPPSGAAVNVSLISSGPRACVGITVDPGAVPDSAKLAGCIEDGFAEVCSARPPGTSV